MAELTPMMLQYRGLKEQHPDEVLFFRLGDFYEMFDTDAVEVSRLLNLTLTHRAGQPMCGIPFHASKIYIARLLRLGKKIAICEQVSMPQNARTLAERKVVEIITPGTAVEEEYLEQTSHNYLASLSCSRGKAGFAFIDISTGVFSATSWNLSDMAQEFSKELGRCSPREMVLPLSLKEQKVVQEVLASHPAISISYYPDWHFAADLAYKRLTEQFRTANLRSFSLTETSPEVPPAGFLLDYLSKNFNSNLPHISGIQLYKDSDFVVIDDFSRRNLELVANLRDGTVHSTLLETLNFGVTAMGKRLIRSWLLSPLRDYSKIMARQNLVTELVAQRSLLKEVREGLSSILDLERLTGRVAMDRAHGKNLQALKASLYAWLHVHKLIQHLNCTGTDITDAKRVADLIHASIVDDPAIVLTEGNLIKSGWSQELDHLKSVRDNFGQILDEYVEEERRNSGISNLKVRYNRVSGYYIEVSIGKIDTVPAHFILRRSMVNGNRYTTARLQELEQELNSADTGIMELERSLFLEVRDKVKAFTGYLFQVAKEIAYTDCIASLAQAAVTNQWGPPEISEEGPLEIVAGRHPVVEQHLPSGEFVPNDGYFSQDKYFALITGPNMAGKSTYLRQTALITLLAQTGSFVPARSARIPLVDKIFCRVGASDNLARGESTFLVEMTETAHILRSATEKSLVIMDEVGRGTSTEDGLSIAWAVSEYLLNNIRCITLFATHYHELTRLVHPALLPLCLEVLEQEGEITFLKKIKEGSVANSYGIHVAQLAGVPQAVIQRAEVLLQEITQKVKGSLAIPESIVEAVAPVESSVVQESQKTQPVFQSGGFQSPGLFSDEELILDEILSTDTDKLAPIEALLRIARWKKALSGK